jgi:hypothetical protein
MIIKTNKFLEKLRSVIYEINVGNNFKELGISKHNNFISNLKYSVEVHYGKKFKQNLIDKLRLIGTSLYFFFVYVRAGIDVDFILPWKIYTNMCDFDMDKTESWYKDFKSKNLVSLDVYKSIEDILNKPKLCLRDLIKIEYILKEYSSIKWFFQDIVDGEKTIKGRKYSFVKSLINAEETPMIQYIYKSNSVEFVEFVGVEEYLVDKKYYKYIENNMYQYYMSDWYKILKSYKRWIGNDYYSEYIKVIKKTEVNSVLLSMVNLIELMNKYKYVGDEGNVERELRLNLEDMDIETYASLDEVRKFLEHELNSFSERYVQYFLDKLTNDGKIEKKLRLKDINIGKICVTLQRSVTRSVGLWPAQRSKGAYPKESASEGNEVSEGGLWPAQRSKGAYPKESASETRSVSEGGNEVSEGKRGAYPGEGVYRELNEKIYNYINYIGDRIMIDNNKFRYCLEEIGGDLFIELVNSYMDKKVNNMFLKINKFGNVVVRGVFRPDDDDFFNSLNGDKMGDYYILDGSLKTELQKYLLKS